MYQAVFIACLTQGLLPGLAVLVLLAAALRLQKQYGPQRFCRLWTKLAVLALTACCAGSMVACKTVEPLPESSESGGLYVYSVTLGKKRSGRTFSVGK